MVPAPSVDELDVTDFNHELTAREIAAQSSSAEANTSAKTSAQPWESGNILLDVADFNRELTDREIAAQSSSAEANTSAKASEDGNILLDVIFTSHPGVPTGSNMLNLAAELGADVTAGTFESMGQAQVGRLALSIPAALRDSIIDQLRAKGAHVEVRSL